MSAYRYTDAEDSGPFGAIANVVGAVIGLACAIVLVMLLARAVGVWEPSSVSGGDNPPAECERVPGPFGSEVVCD